jgi:hypothetical protein
MQTLVQHVNDMVLVGAVDTRKEDRNDIWNNNKKLEG